MARLTRGGSTCRERDFLRRKAISWSGEGASKEWDFSHREGDRWGGSRRMILVMKHRE
jgi:hypothetical protein